MKFVIANTKRFGKHGAVKITDSNIGGREGFVTYPLYSLGFLPGKSKSRVIETVDVKSIKLPE